MSDLTRLRELAALFRPKTVVEDAKATTAFSGIQSVVNDALGDLDDKLSEGGSLEMVLDKAGLSSLGADSLKEVDELTRQYKKDVQAVLLEIELLLASA